MKRDTTKNTYQEYVAQTIAAAVRATLTASAALAMPSVSFAAEEGDEVRALTQPTNYVQVGSGYVSDDSFKFGEYNGLEKQGGYLLGNFDVRGGKGYDSDNSSTLRWQLKGLDLGLQIRSIGAEIGAQGKFRLNYSYDELPRNDSDSYRTPYQGAGTTHLTLPGYPTVRLNSTATANDALTNWINLQAPYASIVGGVPTGSGPGVLIPALMHDFDVSTLRTRHGLGFDLIVTPKWTFTSSASHEEKEGTQLRGIAFGVPIARLNVPPRGALAPEAIDHSTDQFRAGLGYVNKKINLNFSYYGSYFKNDTTSWTVANPFQSTLLNPFFGDAARLRGAPDNQMHRLSLSGGYNFSRTARLVVSGHYARMTQNAPFETTWPANWNIPFASADARVINTNLNATLTARPTRNLQLTTTYRYDNRKDETPVHDFVAEGADDNAAPTLFTTEPINRRTQKFTADGTYSLAYRQAVKLGYEYESIQRERASGRPQPPPSADEQPVRVAKTTENLVRIEYRSGMSEHVTGRASYVYSQRRSSEYGENSLIAPVLPPTQPTADPLTPGFRQFAIADRNRDKIRVALDIFVTEAFSIQTGADYHRDLYDNSPYGLQNANSWVFKLDGAYAVSELVSFNAFYTYEDRRERQTGFAISRGATNTIFDPRVSGACTGYNIAAGHLPSDEGTDPCRNWSETDSDRVHTFGLGFKASELVHKKISLTGDVAYSKARTPIDVTGGAYFPNFGPAGAPPVPNNYTWIAATSLPDITSEVIEVRLGGRYEINKASAVRLDYLYRNLKSSDWQYDAFTKSALGSIAIPTYVGTGMTAPNYNVHVIGLSYIFAFR